VIWLLLASILFAGCQARHIPSLLCYFFAQALYTAIGYEVYRSYGAGSVAYAVVYSAGTAVILLTCLNLVWEALRGRGYVLRAVVVAGILSLTLGKMAFLGLGHPAKYYDWIGLTEGTLLLWCGLLIGGVSPHTRYAGINLALSLLWIAQALFRWGFYLHFPDWLMLNWKVPPALCIVGFAVVGWLARRSWQSEQKGAWLSLGRSHPLRPY
jgi:multidrug transporter EmrE-like cation transporter